MTSETTGIARLLAAAQFVAERHAAQRRKGADAAPYVNHCIEVADTLCRIGGVEDADILVAALMHDTVQDTGTSPDEIEERFGRRVRGHVSDLYRRAAIIRRVPRMGGGAGRPGARRQFRLLLRGAEATGLRQ